MRANRFVGCGLAVLAATLLGCGSSVDVAPVAGTITMDGAPVAGAAVSFQPIAAQGKSTVSNMGSYGKTDDNGKYTLKLIDTDGDGASIGTHRVQVSISQDMDTDVGRKTVDKIPARYRGVDSELTFDVPAEGTQAADFALSSKKR